MKCKIGPNNWLELTFESNIIIHQSQVVMAGLGELLSVTGVSFV